MVMVVRQRVNVGGVLIYSSPLFPVVSSSSSSECYSPFFPDMQMILSLPPSSSSCSSGTGSLYRFLNPPFTLSFLLCSLQPDPGLSRLHSPIKFIWYMSTGPDVVRRRCCFARLLFISFLSGIYLFVYLFLFDCPRRRHHPVLSALKRGWTGVVGCLTDP